MMKIFLVVDVLSKTLKEVAIISLSCNLQNYRYKHSSYGRSRHHQGYEHLEGTVFLDMDLFTSCEMCTAC